MRKALLMCASLVAALFVLGPASASAAEPPQVVACLGAAQSNGSFSPQEINTGNLPQLPLGLSLQGCVTSAPNAAPDWINNVAETLGGIEPPSEPPSAEDIQAILDAIGNIDPSDPFSALATVFAVCQHGGIAQACSGLLGAALGAPLPMGQASLTGESGSCFDGVQSGSGSVFGGGGDFYQLEWTADYTQGANAGGVISGTATTGFGSNARTYDVTGLIGPGCGAGAKGLVLFIN